VTIGGDVVTDYVLGSNGTLLKTSGVWTAGRRNVAVKYTHGFRSSAIPADVKEVALALAQRLVVQGVAMAETNGDVNMRYAVASTDLTNGEKLILTKYNRRP
jgi:hypothetical protein